MESISNHDEVRARVIKQMREDLLMARADIVIRRALVALTGRAR
jgi:hypothetical protein